MPVGINHYIFLSAILLGFGIYSVIAHKNIIRILFGITMIFTASIINFAAFSGFKTFNPEGQIIVYITAAFCLLILFIGAILAYNHYKNTNSVELPHND
jgi:NADH:ubiquinone oxidoreductase subunit K